MQGREQNELVSVHTNSLLLFVAIQINSMQMYPFEHRETQVAAAPHVVVVIRTKQHCFFFCMYYRMHISYVYINSITFRC